MTALVKEYIPDELLGPVKLARLGRDDGSTEGLEISFRESAPEMRDRVMHRILAGIGLVTLCPFVLLVEPVSTILWIAMWNELDGGAKRLAYLVLGGAVIFGIVWRMLTPPFRTAVRIELSPAQDRLSIYRGGRLAESMRLSDIRGVRIAPHPKYADALAAVVRRPNRENRKQAELYCQAECVCLRAGRGAANLDIEVATFMEKNGDYAQTAMRVLAAIETALRMAAQEQAFVAHVEVHGLVLSTGGSLPRRA